MYRWFGDSRSATSIAPDSDALGRVVVPAPQRDVAVVGEHVLLVPAGGLCRAPPRARSRTPCRSRDRRAAASSGCRTARTAQTGCPTEGPARSLRAAAPPPPRAGLRAPAPGSAVAAPRLPGNRRARHECARLLEQCSEPGPFPASHRPLEHVDRPASATRSACATASSRASWRTPPASGVTSLGRRRRRRPRAAASSRRVVVGAGAGGGPGRSAGRPRRRDAAEPGERPSGRTRTPRRRPPRPRSGRPGPAEPSRSSAWTATVASATHGAPAPVRPDDLVRERLAASARAGTRTPAPAQSRRSRISCRSSPARRRLDVSAWRLGRRPRAAGRRRRQRRDGAASRRARPSGAPTGPGGTTGPRHRSRAR